MTNTSKLILIFLSCLFIVALVLRIPNLNTPFWVDEFSSAGQAKLINFYKQDIFKQTDHYFEHHNVTVYWLIAVFFNFFGESTTSARLPFVLIGSIIPLIVYLVTKKIFLDQRHAIVAALLTTFSYFQITWSRQARSYMLQQLCILLSIYIYLELLKGHSNQKKLLLAICFIVISIIALLTHTTYILVLLSIAMHALFYNRKKIFSLFLRSIFILPFVGINVLLYQIGTTKQIAERLFLIYQDGFSNNVWYYHSFLWREHQLITFLAVFGLLYSLFSRRKPLLLFALIICNYLGFHFFLFSPYVSRYILPIFPLLLIFSAQTCVLLADTVSSTIKHKKYQKYLTFLLPILITLGIIANGDTFVTKPKPFYSVNKDMRELALIDYDQVYLLIKNKSIGQEDNTAVIDTWTDRTRWYLGSEFKNLYLFRWIKEEGLVNGLEKRSIFSINESGEKYLEQSGGVLFIGELSDLMLAMNKYPRGFIWIDDSSLPKDVITYAEQNLKKELYLDHYYLDENPYSIWPGTLYSWGVE